MSTDDRTVIRDQIREFLDFEPAENIPCAQVLGIGLVEEVCRDDEALKKWLVCQATEFVVDEDRPIEDALAEAFDLAEDQCDHFDLPFPGERQTSFGPLQAQEVREERREEAQRQAELPGVAPEEETEPPTLQPQRAPPATGEQVGLGGPSREESARATEEAARRRQRQEREAERERPREQRTIGGEEPAKLSEFGNGNGGDEEVTTPDRIVGPEATIVYQGREFTVPNTVATWERRRVPGRETTFEWRSQNVDGHDVVRVERQADGFRAIVATVTPGETAGRISIIEPIGTFSAAINAAEQFMRDNPDGRPDQGNGNPRRRR